MAVDSRHDDRDVMLLFAVVVVVRSWEGRCGMLLCVCWRLAAQLGALCAQLGVLLCLTHHDILPLIYVLYSYLLILLD